MCATIFVATDPMNNFHVGTEDCQRSRTLGQTNINKQCIIQLKSTVPKSAKRLLNPLFIRACCAAACCSAAAWCKCVPPFSWRPAASGGLHRGRTSATRRGVELSDVRPPKVARPTTSYPGSFLCLCFLYYSLSFRYHFIFHF